MFCKEFFSAGIPSDFFLQLFDFRHPGKHQEERELSACEPTVVSEHETMKLKRNITEVSSLMSKNENWETSSVCKAVQQVCGTSPSSTVYGKVLKNDGKVLKVLKTMESGVIKNMMFFPHRCESTGRNLHNFTFIYLFFNDLVEMQQ